jgi:hypothetical protein
MLDMMQVLHMLHTCSMKYYASRRWCNHEKKTQQTQQPKYDDQGTLVGFYRSHISIFGDTKGSFGILAHMTYLDGPVAHLTISLGQSKTRLKVP